MLLKVIGPSLTDQDVYCLDENGKKHLVDFLVHGSLPKGTTRDDLIGRTIEVEFLSPFVEIAYEPRFADEPVEEYPDHGPTDPHETSGPKS